MPGSLFSKADIKGLWAVCWRMLLLGPVVAIFGSLFFIAVVALTCFLPFYAVIVALGGDYLECVLLLVLWLVWLRFGRPIRKLAGDGWEHAGL